MHQKEAKFSSGITLCEMHFSAFQGPDIVNNTFLPTSFPKAGKKTKGGTSVSSPALEEQDVVGGRG